MGPYSYENTTSRLKAMTDPLGQKTNYSYNLDDTLRQTTYTDTSGNALNPSTPNVNFTYHPNYNRVATMTNGTDTTIYSYYPVETPPSLGANQLETVKKQCPSGKKAQDEWKDALKKLEEEIKGQEKEINQKWPDALK